MGASGHRLLQAAIIVSVLHGCTAGNFATSQGDDVRSATVSRPYQEAYRSVREFAKSCYEAGLITAEMKVDAELYTDTKRGMVEIYLLGGAGRQNHFQIEITSEAANITAVTVRRGIRPLINSPSQLDRFIQAAQGNPPSCGR